MDNIGMVFDDDHHILFSEPMDIEYDEEYYEPGDEPVIKMITNETATLSLGTVCINPDVFEAMIGTTHFIRGAVVWASHYRGDLFHYACFSKKTRTRKKYIMRILAAYRAVLWEGCL